MMKEKQKKRMHDLQSQLKLHVGMFPVTGKLFLIHIYLKNIDSVERLSDKNKQCNFCFYNSGNKHDHKTKQLRFYSAFKRTGVNFV